jgi:hypothetical protein
MGGGPGWVSPESRTVHFGGRGPQDCILGNFSRPCGTARWHLLTQDCRPGLLSAVTAGLNSERVFLTQALWPAPVSCCGLNQSPARGMAAGPLLQAPSRSQPSISEIWAASVKGSKGLERMAAAPNSSSLRRSCPCTLAVNRSTGM